MAMPGCSGDNTVVAEGDPTARRKSKEEALQKMINPSGAPVPSAKGKTRSGASKAKGGDSLEAPLP